MSRPGLANLGNTCFMNSLLQILIDIDDFNSIFIKKIILNKNPDSLLNSFKKLYDESRHKNNAVLVPKEFHINLHKYAERYKNNIFSGYNQNDSSELLIFLLDVFHDDIKREVIMKINGNSIDETDDLAIKCYTMKIKTLENEYSEIYDLFYFMQVDQVINKTNKILNNLPSWQCQLSLPLPQKTKNNLNVELIDCIKEYMSGFNYVDTDGTYDTSIKKKQELTRSIYFWNLPNILVIVLQRFVNNNKNNILVNFPINNLDLSNYVVGYNKNSFKYDLIGICNHSGNIHGGHYTSFSKTNNNWYLYNDTGTSLVKNENSIISNNAYCLFYRKKNII
jgi:ubiquitin carboxyl-terminal hydrolase 8